MANSVKSSQSRTAHDKVLVAALRWPNCCLGVRRTTLGFEGIRQPRARSAPQPSCASLGLAQKNMKTAFRSPPTYSFRPLPLVGATKLGGSPTPHPSLALEQMVS